MLKDLARVIVAVTFVVAGGVVTLLAVRAQPRAAAPSVAYAQEVDLPPPAPGGGVDDSDLVLPDGRPLPALPVHVYGEWDQDDLRVYEWQADLAVRGRVFEGKITLPDFPVVLPLTVQGTHEGNIVEFSVLMNEKEVSYFAGHLAGTSLVGTFEAPGGRSGEWSGGWFPDEVRVDPENPGETQ